MKMIASSLITACILLNPNLHARDVALPAIPADRFDALHQSIKPQPGESPWREIPWLTDVTEARKRGLAAGKPLLFFTAADGSPLGRT
ncbi:MAG: hypothetical protein ACI9TH_000549 [Kiritimatiellia bacterium]|jgi:hypothetical protein